MKAKFRQITMSFALTLFALAMFGQALASPSQTDRRISNRIEACVDEIGKHADYSAASRVLHRVWRLRGQSAAQLEIRVDTAVFAAGDEQAAREYDVSCVVDTLGDDVVRFRIEPVVN